MTLAREVWDIYPTKLPMVCRKLRIPLKHHDASSDAEACARIVLAAAKERVELIASPGRACRRTPGMSP